MKTNSSELVLLRLTQITLRLTFLNQRLTDNFLSTFENTIEEKFKLEYERKVLLKLYSILPESELTVVSEWIDQEVRLLLQDSITGNTEKAVVTVLYPLTSLWKTQVNKKVIEFYKILQDKPVKEVTLFPEYSLDLEF